MTGFCYPDERGAMLHTMDGRMHPLAVSEEHAAVRYLDGHTTEIEGTRILRRVHVRDWRVHDGLHGLPTWVGPLVQYGAELGIQDRNSDAFYYIDARAARDLAPFTGQVVLLEGWVEGARRVTVAYFRVLAEEQAQAPEPEDP